MKDEFKIRSLIVDDEPLSRMRIRGMLKNHPEVTIVAECSDGVEAAEAIMKSAPDLVFLDIQMPGMNGFEVLKKVEPERMPLVIFVSAYDKYVLKAFEVHALDYILKPFKRKRFEESLHWAKEQLQNKGGSDIAERTLSLLEKIQARSACVDRLAVKMDGRVFLIKLEEIDWIQSEDNYVRVHRKKDSYLIRQQIGSIRSSLFEFIEVQS
jgi:two-component system, LytTR family, response regulator